MNKVKLAGLVLVLSIFYFPDFLGILSGYSENEVPQDWDSNSMLLWGYAHDSGGVIFKNFWFPYGNSIIFTGRSLQSLVYFFIYRVLVFSIFGILLYLILDKNAYLSIILTLLLCGGESYMVNNTLPLFWGLSRYILSIVIVFSYILFIFSIEKNFINNYFILLLFVINLSLLTYIDQLLLASLPILSIFILYTTINWNKILKKRFIALHTIPLLLIIIYLIILVINNQYEGFIDFYSNLKSNAIASTEPTIIELGISRINLYQVLVILIPAFFLGYSIYSIRNISQSSASPTYYYIYFGLSILTLMVLLKYSVRDMRYQLMIFPIILFVLYLYERCKYNILVSSLVIGILIYYYPNYIYNIYYTLIRGNPQIIYSNINNIGIINVLQNRDQNNFYKIPQSTIHISDEINKAINNQRFYVLGEPSILYITNKKEIPYFISFYDGSSIKNQYKLIDYLKNESINYIIIRRDFKNFDLVSNSVRVPIIFDYVINNYKYITTIENYDILMKVDSDFIPEYDYWKKYLGTDINLGYLPELIRVYENECIDNNKCKKYIRITKNDNKNGVFTINIFNKLIDNNLIFSMHGSKDQAFIDLERLWLSNFIFDNFSSINIKCSDIRIQCDIINVHNSKNKLY